MGHKRRTVHDVTERAGQDMIERKTAKACEEKKKCMSD